MNASSISRRLLAFFVLSAALALFGYSKYYSQLGSNRAEARTASTRTAVVTAPDPVSGSIAASALSEFPALAVAMTGSRGEAPVPAAGPAQEQVPTEQPSPPAAARIQAAELAEFSRRVVNGRPGALCGVYLAGILALRVVQQPAGDGAFISTEDETATQFQEADPFGAVGLLAHNTLAGRDFFKIATGQELILIECDGRAEHYRVTQIADYQRLTLGDLRSDFWSLNTNERQTADQVFAKFYQRAHHLTLQTCIKRGGEASWGVRFVVADHAMDNATR